MTSCALCGGDFQSRGANYCSQACRIRAWKKGYRVAPPRGPRAPEEPSPEVWNGVTAYSESDLLLEWRIVCILCGADRWLRATQQRVKQARYFAPCVRCGGKRIVDADFGARRPALVPEQVA